MSDCQNSVLGYGVVIPGSEAIAPNSVKKYDWGEIEKLWDACPDDLSINHIGPYDRNWGVLISIRETTVQTHSCIPVNMNLADNIHHYNRVLEFCESMDIKPEGKPRWFLLAYYG